MGIICSRGGHTKESVLAVELPTTGLSACESAPPSSWAQNPAVGLVWAEREAVLALSPSPQQAHKNIHQELEPPKCKQCGGTFPCAQHHDVPLDIPSTQDSTISELDIL